MVEKNLEIEQGTHDIMLNIKKEVLFNFFCFFISNKLLRRKIIMKIEPKIFDELKKYYYFLQISILLTKN